MWARKRRSQIFLVLIVLCVIALGFGAVYILIRQRTPQADASCDLKLSQSCITLEVSSTEATRAQGLSGRRTLNNDQAMLFVFDQTGRYCFWMKDMNFPIDIVWLDANKKIVSFELNVEPNTYPKSFCPDEPARYVLEFPAGVAPANDLRIGQTLQFQTD